MPHVEIEPGDRVALLVPGSEDYVRLVIGLLQTGVVPVPLDPRLTESERRAVLEDDHGVLPWVPGVAQSSRHPQPPVLVAQKLRP